MSYDIKYRRRVVKFIKEEKNTWKETMRVFGVCRYTIQKWLEKEKKGELEEKARKRTYYKIDPEKVEKYFKEKPDGYIKEAAKELGFSESGIAYVLKHKVKMTLKKRQKYTKNEKKKKG